MICFEVGVNGSVLTTAGIESDGVLSVYLVRRHIRDRESLRLDVSALVHNSCHLAWAKQSLRMGDALTVRVLEQERADDPIERREIVPRKGLSIDESIAIAQEQLAYWQKRLGKIELRKAAGDEVYTSDEEDDRRWWGQ